MAPTITKDITEVSLAILSIQEEIARLQDMQTLLFKKQKQLIDEYISLNVPTPTVEDFVPAKEGDCNESVCGENNENVLVLRQGHEPTYASDGTSV